MHAAGVVVDGRAVLLMGSAGAGKSSLAAALLRAGGRLLSDDAVALQLREGRLIAHAGSLALQLRAAEDERLSPAQRAALGRPVGSVEGKRRYASGEAPAPAPLGCVFLLERSAREPAVVRLGAVDPFELIASTFNLSVRTPARLRRQLDVVCAICSTSMTHRLRVQPGVDATRLAAIVGEYLAGVAIAGGPLQAGAGSERERLLEL
jgi:serine kinase of HPr protein (carbohydrate metabolism regulator)